MSPGATWSISGPAFLLGFPLALLAAAFAVRPVRALIGPRHPDRSTELRPVEIALLRGGDRLAVATALGQLRAADLVDDAGSPTRPVTPGLVGDRFSAVLLADLADRRATRHVDRMVRWPAVAAALERERADLAARGWLRGRRSRDRAMSVRLLPWLVMTLAIVRIGVGVHRQRPVGFLLLEVLAGAMVVVVLDQLAGTPPTPAARREIRRLRTEKSHLAPGLRPSWPTYGPAAAGLSVALWGAPALLAAHPAFAAAIAPVGGGGAVGLGSGFGGSGGSAAWLGGGAGGSSGAGGHGGGHGGGHSCGGGGCGG